MQIQLNTDNHVHGEESLAQWAERELRESEGVTRRDLGREKFLKRVWDFKNRHGDIIIRRKPDAPAPPPLPQTDTAPAQTDL